VAPYALDVSGASKTEGAKLIIWPDNGGLNQRWNLYDFSYVDPETGIYGGQDKFNQYRLAYTEVLQNYLDVLVNGENSELFSPNHVTKIQEPWRNILNAAQCVDDPLQDFGYRVNDINSDGVPELYLVSHTHETNQLFIWAIYSFGNGKASPLEVFWPGKYCCTDGDSKIVICTLGEESTITYTRMEIVENSMGWTYHDVAGSQYDPETGEVYYFILTDNCLNHVSQEEMEDFIADWPTDNTKFSDGCIPMNRYVPGVVGKP
jgi:hypothetical protein